MIVACRDGRFFCNREHQVPAVVSPVEGVESLYVLLSMQVVDRRPTIPQSKENEMYKYTVPIPMDPHSLQKAALDTKDQLLVSAISNSSSVMGLQNHQVTMNSI
jgi:hypothetical protein